MNDAPAQDFSVLHVIIQPQIITSGEVDARCVLVVTALGTIPSRAVEAWLSLRLPQKTARVFVLGCEVSTAYNLAIEHILDRFPSCEYMLTLEHDNLPPPDGAERLLQQMESHPELSAIGGLYRIKNSDEVAIWGDPRETPVSFYPKQAIPHRLVECCAVSMGFTMFRLTMFRDPRLRKPWFATDQYLVTQDFYGWFDFNRNGYRCAVDCAVAVGHYDSNTDVIW